MTIERVGWKGFKNSPGGAVTVDFAPDPSIAVGDWMVLVLAMSASQNPVIAGWNQIMVNKTSGTLNTTIYAKKRLAGDGTYTLGTPTPLVTNTLFSGVLMWFRGVADTGWVVPSSGKTRVTGPDFFTNICDPITTVVPSLVLSISTERTTAYEANYTSMTGATPWVWEAQQPTGSAIETIAVGYVQQTTFGTTPSVSVVYPSTQQNNGYGIQIALPPSAAPAIQSAFSVWNGTTEVPVNLKTWNGTSEVDVATAEVKWGNYVFADLVSTSPFYIAHRGGGLNWPEHTMRSYKGAADWGMKAIEVSCQITTDGVIVCHHDADTSRMTGTAVTIATSAYSALSGLTSTASGTDNPGQNRQPIPLLTDVLDKFGNSHVLFIEPKIGGTWQLNTLMPMIESKVPNAARVVWKQPINSTQWANAKARGWTTWGYVLSQDPNHTNNLDTLIPQANVDYIGVERIASDAFVTDIVARATAVNKKVIMWEIRSIADRDRALALGCVGMMTANIRVVQPKYP